MIWKLQPWKKNNKKKKKNPFYLFFLNQISANIFLSWICINLLFFSYVPVYTNFSLWHSYTEEQAFRCFFFNFIHLNSLVWRVTVTASLLLFSLVVTASIIYWLPGARPSKLYDLWIHSFSNQYFREQALIVDSSSGLIIICVMADRDQTDLGSWLKMSCSWMDSLFLIDRMRVLTSPLALVQLIHMDVVVLLTRDSSTGPGTAI